MKKLVCIVCLVFNLLLGGNGYAIEKHLLLFAPLSEGNQTIVLEVLPTGQIIDSGQRLDSGYGTYTPAVSPDQQRVLTPGNSLLSQFHIAPNGHTSKETTYNFQVLDISYVPDGTMVVSNTTIFRVRNDNALDIAKYYSPGCSMIWMSPAGKTMVSRGPSSGIYTYQIDTVNLSITTSQWIYIDGTAYDATYTPDRSQVLIAKYPLTYGNNNVVDIFQITSNGIVVDSTVQHLSVAGFNTAKSIAIAPDGQYAFIGNDITNGFIATLARTSTGQWVDTGKRVSFENPFRVVSSPVYNLLVVQHDVETAGWIYQYLTTYFINSDGTLVPTGYSFPFHQTFGDVPVDLVFAYPPGVTAVETEQWQLYE